MDRIVADYATAEQVRFPFLPETLVLTMMDNSSQAFLADCAFGVASQQLGFKSFPVVPAQVFVVGSEPEFTQH